MLVLTRKVGEAIAIGNDVRIVVMQIKGKQVRLGIKAGSDTVIHREEVFQRIQDENDSASKAGVETATRAKVVFNGISLVRPSAHPVRRIKKHAKSTDSDEN